MLQDITIGQYFPGESIVHRFDPRLKIITMIFFIISLFFINTSNSLEIKSMLESKFPNKFLISSISKVKFSVTLFIISPIIFSIHFC